MEYMLAPLEGYSDNAFRTLCYNHGADLTFTEMARLDAIIRGNKSTLSRIKLYDETPTVIQLLGVKEESLKKFLENFKPYLGFRGFDINMGCPSPEMIKIGQGCAMVKRIARACNLVDIIKGHGYAASIKMRLGMNKFEKEKRIYLNLIKAANADFFVIHARHGGESYENPADFSVYTSCVDTGKKIIANGDIDSAEKVEGLRKMGVAGVMIGRAAMKDPAIFDRLKGNKATSKDELLKEYNELAERFGSRYRKNVIEGIK